MNRNNLYSRIQSNIGDFIWAKVQREEYYLMFQEVMQELSSKCSFNTMKYEATITVEGYKHLISIPNVEIYKLDYLKRGNIDCREISSQSIATAQSDLGRGFHINDTPLDDLHFSVTALPEGLELEFSNPLRSNEKLEAVLIVNQTDGTDSFTDKTKLPYFAYNALYYGVYTKVLDKLVTSGTGQYNGIYQATAMAYQNAKIELKAYIYNLKTETSFPQIQPLLWLSED